MSRYRLAMTLYINEREGKKHVFLIKDLKDFATYTKGLF